MGLCEYMGAEPEKFDNNVGAGDGLSNDVVESNKVQERGGSYTISIPKDSATDLGIQKGDHLLFLGQEGDDELRVQPAHVFLAKNEDDQ